MTKTDNQAIIGKHVFEAAGCGVAPFRVVGCREEFITYPDGTTQASGCCSYCGTGIRNVFIIRDANGREFKVGSDCVEKTGDAGLIKGYKTSPEYRAIQQAKRRAKGERDRAAYQALLAEHEVALRGVPFQPLWNGTPQTAFDSYTWVMSRCGNAGIARNLNALRRLIARLAQSA